MYKNYSQVQKNKYYNKRKEINQKNQKKKQIKLKKKVKKYKKDEISDIIDNKENIPNEIENVNSVQIIEKEKSIEQKTEIEKEKDKNKNISKLTSENIRYFGKELENPSSLEQRVNQYIIKGSNFKKYFNNNLIKNPNYNNIYENNGATLDLLSIEFSKSPQDVMQYRNDILLNLIKEENNNIPNYSILGNIIDEQIRNKYVQYLITVCDKITKKEEIHYLSINIFDRVICKLGDIKEELSERKLQLICFTALFIAYKYETGCYFLIDDLLKHTEDSLVEKDEILRYEIEINKILDFEYLIVYPSHFLNHYEFIDNINNRKLFYFCLYLLDFILSDINLMCNKKSLISASCFYIAKANLLKINVWPNIFQFFTGYSKKEVKELSIKIITAMKNSKNSAIFKCLKKKYSKDEYFKVVDSIIGKK